MSIYVHFSMPISCWTNFALAVFSWKSIKMKKVLQIRWQHISSYISQAKESDSLKSAFEINTKAIFIRLNEAKVRPDQPFTQSGAQNHIWSLQIN